MTPHSWLLQALVFAPLLALAQAGSAYGLGFDGSRAGIVTPSSQRFVAGVVESISIDATVTRGTGDQVTLLTFATASDLYMIQLDFPSNSFILSTAGVSTTFGKGLFKSGEKFSLLFAPANGGWSVTVNGTATASLPDEFLPMADTDSVTITVGDATLIGTLSRFEVARTDGKDFRLADDGQFVTFFRPQLGTYTLLDGEINDPQRLDIEGLERHGIYPREHFFAIEAYQGAYVLIFDWGGYVGLRIDPDQPNALIPTDPANFWVGRLRFNPGSNAVFRAEDVHSRPGVPFLQNGESYSFLESTQGLAVDGKQDVSEVWAIQDFPNGFDYSRIGCYNITEMDLTDYTLTGCPNSVFDFPLSKGANFTEKFGKTIPFGWVMDQRAKSTGGYVSTLVEDESGLARGQVGGSGNNFSLLGVDVSSNTKTSAERSQRFKTERMTSVHKYIGTSHALVLDPAKVLLHHCFIKRVLRAAPGAKAPTYFAESTEASYGRNLTGERCTEAVSGPSFVPIREQDLASKLIAANGTHYAQAITYGAIGYRFSYFTKENVVSALSTKTDVDSAIQFDMSKAAKSVGEKAPGGLKIGEETKTEKGRDDDQSSLVDSQSDEYTCLGGSGCYDGKPDIGDRLIPIYLQLRPLDELLAPPYFTDPKITIELRQKVRRVLRETTRLASPRERIPAFEILKLSFQASCNSGQFDFGTFLCKDGFPKPLADAMSLYVFGIDEQGKAHDFTPSARYPVTALSSVPLNIPIQRQLAGNSKIVKLGISLIQKDAAIGQVQPFGDACEDGSCLTLFSLEASVEITLYEPCAGEKLNDALQDPVNAVFGGRIGANESECLDELEQRGIPRLYDDLRVQDWSQARLNLGKADGRAKGAFQKRDIVVDLPVRGQPVTFDKSVLTLDKPTGEFLKYDDLRGFGVGLSGAVELADIGDLLGFDTNTSVSLPEPEPENLVDAAPVSERCGPGFIDKPYGCVKKDAKTDCPPSLKAVGKLCVIARPEDGTLLLLANPVPTGIVSRYAVSFTVQGAPQRMRTRNLPAGQTEMLMLPAAAQNIVVSGEYSRLLDFGKIFTSPVDPAEPIACFATRGTALNPHVTRECF